jgi:hypothetical protein
MHLVPRVTKCNNIYVEVSTAERKSHGSMDDGKAQEIKESFPITWT